MKTPLSKIWLRCTLCALLIGMQACDNSPYVTEILLRANFNEDDLQLAPDETLPGDPIGDELNDSGVSAVINSPFSGGALALLKSYYEYTDSPIHFIARASSFSGVVKFSWNGQLVDWYNQQLFIRIDDGHGKILVELVIAGQGLHALHIGDGTYLEGEHLGYPFPRDLGNAATKHVFIIEVDYAHKTFDLTLAGQDLTQNVFKYTNLPIFDPNVVLSPNTRPTLKVFSYVASGGNACGYITDNVIISRKFISIPDVDL